MKSVPDVKFCLVFQSETLSVPVMRRVLGDTLRGVGVDEESVYDILLAATEACTNVLTHGGEQVSGYEVVTKLDRSAARSRWRMRASACRRPRRGRCCGWSGGRGRPGTSTRSRSLSCPSRAAAWRSCGPAWTRSRWTACAGRGTVVIMHKHISWSSGRPAAPAPNGQLNVEPSQFGEEQAACSVRIGVVTFPGRLTTVTRRGPSGWPGPIRSRCGMADRDLRGMDAVCCPAGSPTATTCAAARSPSSAPDGELVPPPGPGCRCSASATASRSCARRTCCPGR